MAGEGSSTWMSVAPAATSAAISAARTGTNASAAASRVAYTCPGPVTRRPDSVNGPGSVTRSGRAVRVRAYRNSSTTPSPAGAVIGSTTSKRCC